MADSQSDLPILVAGAHHDDLARTVLAIAAMHEPEPGGHCRWCQPQARWWRRRPAGPCRTHRVIVAELRTIGRPRWMSA
ncbi:MAG TPA: hypothetical protein VFX70_07220 [Mycobacteriales bacterium]|nr:hypothetical protein [Mycobacteriales bacterium]